jgi:hypothetical protein
MHFISTGSKKICQSKMNIGENDFPLAGMPLEKKYKQVQGLQSQILRKKDNSSDGKAGISVKMSVCRFSPPKFPENLQLQRCAKPDFSKSDIAEMQHASGKKIRVCAILHTPISPEFRQSGIFTRHFFRNIGSCTASHDIFPGIMAFEMAFMIFFRKTAGAR